ncbi:hypothetical protein DL98DRAFT_538121 [Cadophora sp. DSE1049]|nr:hypothetical protein DL98DRAFT_538121 [Cadophora sp. DSE1049]
MSSIVPVSERPFHLFVEGFWDILKGIHLFFKGVTLLLRRISFSASILNASVLFATVLNALFPAFISVRRIIQIHKVLFGTSSRRRDSTNTNRAACEFFYINVLRYTDTQSQRMDSLSLPEAPRKRRSTNQLGNPSKRAETERAAGDQQFAGELVAENGPDGSEDIDALKEELKFDQKLSREAKGNPPAKYVLRAATFRRRLFCCSCEDETGYRSFKFQSNLNLNCCHDPTFHIFFSDRFDILTLSGIYRHRQINLCHSFSKSRSKTPSRITQS